MAYLRHGYHVIGLALVVAATLLFIYVSRFWIWTAPWSNDGLFGLKVLSPYGDILRRWLSGTWFRDFDLLIWCCAAIVSLSVLQRLWARFKN